MNDLTYGMDCSHGKLKKQAKYLMLTCLMMASCYTKLGDLIAAKESMTMIEWFNEAFFDQEDNFYVTLFNTNAKFGECFHFILYEKVEMNRYLWLILEKNFKYEYIDELDKYEQMRREQDQDTIYGYIPNKDLTKMKKKPDSTLKFKKVKNVKSYTDLDETVLSRDMKRKNTMESMVSLTNLNSQTNSNFSNKEFLAQMKMRPMYNSRSEKKYHIGNGYMLGLEDRLKTDGNANRSKFYGSKNGHLMSKTTRAGSQFQSKLTSGNQETSLMLNTFRSQSTHNTRHNYSLGRKKSRRKNSKKGKFKISKGNQMVSYSERCKKCKKYFVDFLAYSTKMMKSRANLNRRGSKDGQSKVNISKKKKVFSNCKYFKKLDEECKGKF
jgi:hypothetical protein